MAGGWYEKREGGRQRPIQLVVVVNIGTVNEDVTTTVNKQQIMNINPFSLLLMAGRVIVEASASKDYKD